MFIAIIVYLQCNLSHAIIFSSRRHKQSYDVITFFRNIFISRRPSVAIFVDIIKIVTMYIKPIFKNTKKVKQIRNSVPKSIYIGAL